ncbi:MAG: phenylalanine--tRNA ligase subunit beta [Nanoarchaeota archaeon]|nr:phenylalanine--tRNA ligase subunit beta [Nanoarchaeota archaeon]
MPSITLNKAVFEQLVGKKLPLDELKDRISMLGTDLEDIKDNEIHVEIFPNRPDMLSEQGFARAFSSFIGVKTGLRKYTVKESGYKVMIDLSVTMRPYTACAIVKNLTFNDESLRQIIQLQEKLATTHGRNRKKSAYGIYPLQHITFPILYGAKDPKTVRFKPLSFEEEMPASEVMELHPKGKAYQHLTEGWKKYPFFIDAKNKVMCMLPFTNSNDTGKVDETTTEVFVECTGTDFFNVEVALNIITTALADMGGEIYSLKLDYPDGTKITPNLTPQKMKLDLPYINKRLGLQLSGADAGKLLERMGYGFQNGEVLIPAYRADILHQADLMEDIAIAYGYENFEAIIPNVATIGQEDAFEKFLRKVRELLIGLQLLEVKNYHLSTKEELTTKMNVTDEARSNDAPLRLRNALGEHNHLRNWLLPSVLKNLAENQRHEYPQNLFEIGRTFRKDASTETGIGEREHLTIALCHDKADFTEMRQVLDALLLALGVDGKVKESAHPSFLEGRCAEIIVNGKNAGFWGELHPQVLGNWDLLMPVMGLELDAEALFAAVQF